MIKDIETLKSMARFSMKNMVMMAEAEEKDDYTFGNSSDYHRGALDTLMTIAGGQWGRNSLGYHIDWDNGDKEYLIKKDYGKESAFSNGEWQIA